MSDTLTLKRGDTSPALAYALQPTTINLTSATVVFNMRNKSTGTVKINRGAATVVTATGSPTLGYLWLAADTDTAGVYEGEFEVTYADTTKQTFPADGFITIVVTPDIA